jgi:hypothetical protein
MTYNEIKQRVYDIVDIPVAEMVRVGYTKKIHRIFNEATFRIAHSVMPNLREYTVVLSKDKLPAKVIMPPDFISFADEQNAYLNGKNFILTRFVDRNAVILTGTETESSAEVCEYKMYYNAEYPIIIDGGQNYSCVSFVTRINADGYDITAEPVETSTYDWPQIIGQLIPHYIASQLLSNDDKVRSITEMNNFEVLLASVNVERNERQREYHSVRGWY